MKKSMLAIIILMGLVVYGVYDYYGKGSSESSPATEEAGAGAGAGGGAEAGAEAEAGNIQQGIQKGQKAPDFELKDLQGQTVKLSDFQGKKVMINFWATWCPPCRVEMPHMQKFYADYNKQGVVILAVNLTPTEENADSVPAFVKDYGLTFPVVLDEKGTTMQTYQVVAYPTTYLLDSNGVIREKFQGAINYDMMKQAVSKIK